MSRTGPYGTIAAARTRCGSAVMQPLSTSATAARTALAIVDELERDAEVGLLQKRDDLLERVPALAGHADLLALNGGLDALQVGVLDLLDDRFRLLLVDALHDRDVDLRTP